MKHLFLIILLSTLSACGGQTVVPPTETSIPTVASPTSVPTSTSIPVTVTPSPLPTEPVFPVITPDPIQIERWKEYEDALAKTFFPYSLRPQEVVCEWEILGQTNEEVYVWAYCAGIYSVEPSQASIPAVIHIRTDGSVQSAEIPGSGSSYGVDIRRMFPLEVQERIFGRLIHFQVLADRLRWRRGHPEEPPWIVHNSLPTQSTQSVIPVITPEPMEVERWIEYQTALASSFLSYLPPEAVICEWEILGRSSKKVYVWAICIEASSVGSLEGLAVIHIAEDGYVYTAETAGIGGMGFPSDIERLFPLDVQERYYSGLIHFQELVDHLRWRQKHREEPPLIVLSANRTP